MKVNVRPRNQPPLKLFTQAPLRTTMVAVCVVRERRHQACRIATWHWHSLPSKGPSNRRRCCCCSCRVLCSLRHVINHPVCACVCTVSVCLCVRACTTFPRTSKRFRGKWRHKFKFGVSFVRFCYCNGHSPLSQRCVASQSSFVTKQINLRQRQRVQQS